MVQAVRKLGVDYAISAGGKKNRKVRMARQASGKAIGQFIAAALVIEIAEQGWPGCRTEGRHKLAHGIDPGIAAHAKGLGHQQGLQHADIADGGTEQGRKAQQRSMAHGKGQQQQTH